ncbi:NAD(P)-binding protein [Apiospora arundinis]|uniref:NAD(P)-binding protein n=1 Tax=Apiospora arundinis TaxID=335852 RepID=A0ABR2JHV9_9PEZI
MGHYRLNRGQLLANILPHLLGSIGRPSAVYGSSKAAAHWLTKRINTEEDKVTAFVLHPGWAARAMGNRGANRVGLEQLPHRSRNQWMACFVSPTARQRRQPGQPSMSLMVTRTRGR